MSRDVARMADEPFDLLVVGGGIYGAWSAYDASLRGLRVALVERADWGAGTSSASSKLLHGGLRYLEQLRFVLVRKSLAERGLLARLAPHRVRPLRFVLPMRRGDRVGRLRLAAGLSIYDALTRGTAPAGPHVALDADGVRERCPFLAARGLLGGFEFGDCTADDARMVLEIVLGARSAGAATAHRAEVLRLLRTGGRVTGAEVEDRLTGARIEVRAQVVLDAGGARAGRLAGDGTEARRLVRLSKGIHLVLPALPGDRAVVLVARADGRPVFLIPWYGRTLLGTTDEDFRGDPDDARTEPHEVAYLLAEANRALEPPGFSERDVLASFAGLRALRHGGARSSADASREWSLEEPEERYLVSVGGKLTSGRADAARAVDRVQDLLGRPRAGHPTATRPLPWSPDAPLDVWLERTAREGCAAGLDPETARDVAWRYGSSSGALHAIVRADPTLAARLDPELPFCRGEVVHAIRNEMALTLEDVARRRLPLLLVARRDGGAIESAARVLAAELGRSPEGTREEVAAARALRERF